MDTKTKIIVCTASLATAFAVGRFTTPSKVITETKIVEVEKKVEVVKETKAKDKKKTTKTVIKISPSGEKTITKEQVSETKSQTDKGSVSSTDSSKSSDESKKTTNNNSSLNISVLAGKRLGDPLEPIAFGGHVTKNVIGPVTIGIFGLSNMTFGASVGLQF